MNDLEHAELKQHPHYASPEFEERTETFTIKINSLLVHEGVSK
jgi:hypothetical protein